MLSLCLVSTFFYNFVSEYWLASLVSMLMRICGQIKAAQHQESRSGDSALHWSVSITFTGLVKLYLRAVPATSDHWYRIP